MSKRKTHEQFISEMGEKNPNVTVLGKYVTANTPIRVQCKKCKHIWNARPANLLGSRNTAPSGCPKCANNLLGNTDDFIQEMRIINSSIIILGEYKGNKTPIRVQCKECGKIWNPTPNTLRLGHGCPVCSHKRAGLASRLTHEEFIQRVANANPDVEVLGRYKTALDKVKVRCKSCGYEWDVAPFNLIYGSGCPSCAKSGTSYMQQYILGAFRAVLGDESVKSRDTNTIGRELDIYIPSLRFAIEPGGWNWHKDNVERDKEKRDLCKEAGIRLITVYDSCNCEIIPFDTDCYKYPIDLGAEANHGVLRSLAIKLLEDAGIDYGCLTDDDWMKVEEFARSSSSRISTEQFAKRLKKVNPDIEVLGNYVNSTTKIQVRSRDCGHIFDAAPVTLLRGQGCPKCRYKKSSRSLRKGRETFITELAQIAPTIEVIGDYSTTNDPITVRCSVCGYEWKPTPHNLLDGHGCPRCSGCERMNTSSFKQKMKEINPNITICSEFIKNTTPVHCKCNICNTEWETTPKSLKRGSGCPKCTKQKRAEKRKLTDETYRLRLKAKNDNIELLSNYTDMNSKVKARCRVCGRELEVSAGELLHRACLRHLHIEE